MGETNSKSDIASQWLPTSIAVTIMDPNRPEPLVKLPNSIEHDSLQFHTNVSIDSTTTLNCVSQIFFDTEQSVGEEYLWFKNRCSNCKRIEDFH